MKHLNELLIKARPIVNAVGLEKAAGLPNNTLGRHYRWADKLPHGQPCSPNHFAPIVRALCEVAGCVEVAGWTVRANKTLFICVKDIPNRQVKFKEVRTETSSTFEYKFEQWQCLLDDIEMQGLFS